MNNDKFDNLSVSQITFLIDEWIKNEDYRKIAKRRLIDGRTMEQLSNEFNLSVPQIKTICYKCENTVFKNLDKLIK